MSYTSLRDAMRSEAMYSSLEPIHSRRSGGRGPAWATALACARSTSTSEGEWAASREQVAAVLALGSAFVASLLAVDASFLAKDSSNVHWSVVFLERTFLPGTLRSVVSLVLNGVSLPLLLAASRWEGALFPAHRRPPGGAMLSLALSPSSSPSSVKATRESRGWVVARAVLGGFALNAGIAAIAYLDLPSANCIMFSMPCWTVMVACLVHRTLPRPADAVRLVTGFCGMVLVVAPWGVFSSSSRGVADPATSRRNRLVGYAGALGFALSNAGANVITNAKLHRTRPTQTTAAQAAAGLCFATVAVAWAPDAEERARAWALVASPRSQPPVARCLLLVAVAFPVSALLRTAALCQSASVHVVSLLYAEIPLVVLWDRLLRGTPLVPRQLFGVVLIVGGVGIANAMVRRRRHESANNKELLTRSWSRPRSPEAEEKGTTTDRSALMASTARGWASDGSVVSPDRTTTAQPRRGGWWWSCSSSKRTTRRRLLGTFFALGAGSSVTSSSLSLAVAYLKAQLGNGAKSCRR